MEFFPEHPDEMGLWPKGMEVVEGLVGVGRKLKNDCWKGKLNGEPTPLQIPN